MSDDWHGDRNPGHQRRVERWHAIEAEYGEPIVDVIRGLRHQDGGNSWRTVAGTLGCSRSTLQEWRRALGLPMDQHDNIYDPSSTPELTPTDAKAQALGYESATDAVIDMRLCQGLTIFEAADALGVHYTTITAYTPLELRGALYNRSDDWWRQRREWAAEMLERFKAARAKDGEWHPFNYGNGRLFQERW